MPLLIEIIDNVALLIALGVVYFIVGHGIRGKLSFWRNLTAGVILGLLGILLISYPWELTKQVYFNSTSILMVISGLFFGSLATTTGVVVASFYRIYLGGIGWFCDVLIMITAGLLGVTWRHVMKGEPEQISMLSLFALGFINQIFMLFFSLLFYGDIYASIFPGLVLPFLMIYPIGTVLLGVLIARLRQHRNLTQQLEHINRVLSTERDLLELVFQEQDEEELIRKTATLFTEKGGFHHVVISLSDGHERIATLAITGFGEVEKELKEELLGSSLPQCFRRISKEEKILLVRNTLAECQECPLKGFHPDLNIFCGRLEYGSEMFGLLIASLPPQVFPEPKVKNLFLELCEVLSFALHSMRVSRERKRIERELVATVNRLESIFRVSPAGIGVVRDRVFLEVNPTVCRITGYSREELIGKNAIMLYPSQKEYDYVGREKYRQIETAGVGTVETRWKRKDGEIIDVLLSSTWLDPGDHSRGVTFLVLDISARKKAERRLRQNRELLLTLSWVTEEIQKARSEEEVFWIVCKSGKITGIATTIIKLIDGGYLKVIEHNIIPEVERFVEDVIGEKIKEHRFTFRENGIIDTLIKTRAARFLTDLHEIYLDVLPVKAQDKIPEIDAVVKWRQGIAVPMIIEDKVEGLITFTGERISEDDLPAFITFTNQISTTVERLKLDRQLRDELERSRQLEQELKEERDLLRMYLDTVEAIIVVVDRKGHIRLINQRGCQLFGLQEKDLLNKYWFERCYPNLKEFKRHYRAFQNLICGRIESIDSHESVINDGKGNIRYILWNVTPLKDSVGRIIGTLAAGTDITEVKKVESKLRQYQRQLRELSSRITLLEEKERKEIAADLHDRIGQSLAVATMKVSELLMEVDQAELHDKIKKLKELIEKIVSDTKSLTFEISPPILYELGLTSALEWLTEKLQQEHGITITFVDDEQKKPLSSEKELLLYKATREILINAIKHARAKTIQVITRRVNQQLKIMVQDDGTGFNVDEVLNRTGLKKGFGLFNIRERIRHMGGSLKIESSPETGTRVTMWIPLYL